MSQAQTVPALSVQERPVVHTAAETASIPGTMWVMLIGTSLSVVGAAIDLAWHMSIGRDSFWTPGHILVHMESTLGGIACLYTIWSATFSSSSRVHDASVRVLGLRAPGGTFIALWGSIAMLSSAPFDNWWHNAYGLDTKLITPPHLLLALGSLALKTGVMTWMASIINGSKQEAQSKLSWLFLIIGGLCVAQFAVLGSGPWLTLLRSMHTARLYLSIGIFLPTMTLATGWGSRHRWGCSIATAVCMGVALAGEWLLPLVPAQPKLGPVYHNITHLVPYGFPLLLIVPAFAADLLLQKFQQKSSWIKAAWIGPVYVLSLMVVQWPFANFLMSPASRNWFFGTAYFAYADPAGVLFDPYTFVVVEKTAAQFVLTLIAAMGAAILTTRLGLGWGEWLRRIRR
jgi:hypothetical protein